MKDNLTEVLRWYWRWKAAYFGTFGKPRVKHLDVILGWSGLLYLGWIIFLMQEKIVKCFVCTQLWTAARFNAITAKDGEWGNKREAF